MIPKAIEIANKAHLNQTDKSGHPYILHPLRVMLHCEGEIEQTAAILHDVIEDSDWTLEELRQEGFSEEVLEIIDILTRRSGEDYAVFISRILPHRAACRVKLADLNDNLDQSRIADPHAHSPEKLERYLQAKAQVLEALSKP